MCFCYSGDKKRLQIQCLFNYSSGHQRGSVYLCQSIALRYDIVLYSRHTPGHQALIERGTSQPLPLGKHNTHKLIGFSWSSSYNIPLILGLQMFLLTLFWVLSCNMMIPNHFFTHGNSTPQNSKQFFSDQGFQKLFKHYISSTYCKTITLYKKAKKTKKKQESLKSKQGIKTRTLS